MAEYPALPLWTDAWLADTGHLSRNQRGTYLDFLILIWRTPGCRVPNDNRWLENKLRMTPAEVDKELRPLIKEFCKCTKRWIRQKRLSQEYFYVKNKSEKNRFAANTRWAKEKDTSDRNAPTPTPTPIEETRKKKVTDSGFVVGVGAGAVGKRKGNGLVTIADPHVRLGRFMNSLAKHMGGDTGWAIILAATDASDMGHAQALAMCRDAARQLGKGWPHEWPTDGKFFQHQGDKHVQR